MEQRAARRMARQAKLGDLYKSHAYGEDYVENERKEAKKREQRKKEEEARMYEVQRSQRNHRKKLYPKTFRKGVYKGNDKLHSISEGGAKKRRKSGTQKRKSSKSRKRSRSRKSRSRSRARR